MTLEQIIDRARQYGYEGIEIDGKRPHGNPLDLPSPRCRELRLRADDAGVPIYAVAANNDFASPIPEHRESQLAYVKELIRMTADLGAPVLRMFCAWPGVTLGQNGGRYDIAQRVWRIAQHETGEAALGRCREGLVECSRWAAEHGVTLALQNHPPVIADHRDMLRMIAEVDSPALKACFDAPLAHMQGVTAMREAAAEVGPLQVLSHFGGEYERDADGRVTASCGTGTAAARRSTSTPSSCAAWSDIGYDGVHRYELCHPLPKVDGVTGRPGLRRPERAARRRVPARAARRGHDTGGREHVEGAPVATLYSGSKMSSPIACRKSRATLNASGRLGMEGPGRSR